MFCERCGIQLIAQQSTCGRCEISPTRHWLQLTSLIALSVAVACNAVVTVYLLGQPGGSPQLTLLFRVWLWISEALSLYGWVLVAVALLTWAFWPRFGYTPEWEVHAARSLLILALLGGIVRLVLPWVTSESVAGFRILVSNHPRIVLLVAWSAVLLALGLLCRNPETRDELLGDGRILSIVSLSLLFVIVVLTLIGWVA